MFIGSSECILREVLLSRFNKTLIYPSFLAVLGTFYSDPS